MAVLPLCGLLVFVLPSASFAGEAGLEVESLSKDAGIVMRGSSTEFSYPGGESQPFFTDITNKSAEAVLKGTATLKLKDYMSQKNALELSKVVEVGPSSVQSLMWSVVGLPPAVYLVEAKLERDGAVLAEQTCRIVFNTDAISGLDVPDDFDEFWKAALEEQSRIPADLKMEKVSDADKSEIYKFSFAGLQKHRCYGYLSVPADKSARVPGIMIFPSSGVHGLKPPYYPEGDVAVMAVNINFWDVDLPKEEYEWQTWPAPYLVTGILTRETYSLRFSYAALIRALELLAGRPEVQADNILAFGNSQGGGLALVAAGLAPDRFKAVVANVPALCRIDRYMDQRPPYFPIAFNSEIRPRIEETLKYYDAVHFAKRIKVPVLMSVGLMDDVTPAESAIAAYNAVPAEFRKRLLIDPEGGHNSTKLEPDEAAKAGLWR